MSDLWWPKFLRKPSLRLRLPRVGEVRLPSKWLFLAITIGIYYFILSGSIYTLTFNPPAFGSSGSTIIPIWPSIHRQFSIEGIVGAFFFILGFAGFYLVYHSTRHVYRPRYAQMLLAIGWALIFISFLVAQFLLQQKIPS